MFKVIGVVVRWFPAIIGVIMSLEAVLNPDVAGEEKRKAAIAAVTKFLQALGVHLTAPQLEALGKVIDGIVAVLNVLGVFKKDSEEPLAPEVAALPVEAARSGVAAEAEKDEELAKFLQAK